MQLTMAETPRMFRLIVQVSDLKAAVAFYSALLGTEGRSIRGSRHYFDCGSMILAVLDPGHEGVPARPLPDYLYFSVENIDAVHARAVTLGCLSGEDVHGRSAAEIVTRPWGERSFYVRDPFGNGLCFVEAGTEFTGK